MQQTIHLRLLPSEAASESIIRSRIAETAAIEESSLTGFSFIKQSIDARGKQPMVSLSLIAFINEPAIDRKIPDFSFRNVSNSNHRVLIVGTGPAGLFAALNLLENGIKPILIERGKDIRSRRRDLAILNKEGIVDPESNYCFGEGGAGTYSDGKLYTRSSKRGDVNRILALFVHFGADEKIIYESHPHIGTNKLPQIITAMRQKIRDCGGEIHFEKKLSGLVISKGKLKSVVTADTDNFNTDAVVLATGHSARDIFLLLHMNGIRIEAKPFALGVRVEHPQSLIDSAQYHCAVRGPYLPPASYSWVQQVDDKGVFSFCMCPGGIIAPAATSPGELVVNGWSPSKRNNPFANSGIVVTVEPKDAWHYLKTRATSQDDDPLLLMKFQKEVEGKAFLAGGGGFVAPALRLVDFTNGKLSTSLPACSYIPGTRPYSLKDFLPRFINKSLQQAFKSYGRKMPGYLTNEAIVVATESRTSSPVRIPRDPISLQHPQIEQLYPCGEGAGYAGGIVSAAMDGERVAQAIARKLKAHK